MPTSFFYIRDVTLEGLREFPEPHGFSNHYGVDRASVEMGRLKLGRAGTGEVWPIESKFLEPVVHSLMEIDGFTVSEANCARLVLLVDKPKRELHGTHVSRYIAWGEKQGFHKRATCAARVTAGDHGRSNSPREWYDLTHSRRGKMFWMKSSQYKHAIASNDHAILCNCNLYDVFPKDGVDENVLLGILNSSLVVLSKQQYGRPVGVEGNLKTEVVDVNMMLAPNPIGASRESIDRVASAFKAMKTRKVLGFLSERRLRRMAFTQKG